jgi:hypothetical protein
MAEQKGGSAAHSGIAQDDAMRAWTDGSSGLLVRLIETTASTKFTIPLDADSLLWFYAETLFEAVQTHQLLQRACRRLGERLNTAAALVISREHLFERIEAMRAAGFTVWLRPGTDGSVIELYVRPAADRVASFQGSRACAISALQRLRSMAPLRGGAPRRRRTSTSRIERASGWSFRSGRS